MIRKYHNHQLQTNPWQRKKEPHSNHETPGRQTKQSNQLPLPHQDDCKTKRDIKKRATKHRTLAREKIYVEYNDTLVNYANVERVIHKYRKRQVDDDL